MQFIQYPKGIQILSVQQTTWFQFVSIEKTICQIHDAYLEHWFLLSIGAW